MLRAVSIAVETNIYSHGKCTGGMNMHSDGTQEKLKTINQYTVISSDAKADERLQW